MPESRNCRSRKKSLRMSNTSFVRIVLNVLLLPKSARVARKHARWPSTDPRYFYTAPTSSDNFCLFIFIFEPDVHGYLL